MELEKQVCSLELAKKLKELGVPQDSYFFWYDIPVITPPQYELITNSERLYRGGLGYGYAAFTVAELGEMLPWDIVVARNIDKEWIITFQANGLTEDKTASYKYLNEANARAMMLIYLIENNLLTL